jgi:hypothetical protein
VPFLDCERALDYLPSRTSVALKIGLRCHQSLSIAFQTADHQCAFRRTDDESRQLTYINAAHDLPPLDTRIDDRAEEIMPFVKRLASALAQGRIAIVRINRSIQ